MASVKTHLLFSACSFWAGFLLPNIIEHQNAAAAGLYMRLFFEGEEYKNGENEL
jgi:hypothetical protein